LVSPLFGETHNQINSIFILPALARPPENHCYNTFMPTKTIRYLAPLALLGLLLVLLAACSSGQEQSPSASDSPVPSLTVSPSPTREATPTLSPAAPDTATPEPTSDPPTQTPPPAASQDFQVRHKPDWALFTGDLVSFEVIAPAGMDVQGKNLQVQVLAPLQQDLGSGTFYPFGIGGRLQATFIWVWDTTGLQPGAYRLLFQVEDGPAWEEDFYLNPQDTMTAPEPRASWASAESDCCIIHYVTGTPGERDLAWLLEEADRQAALTEARMDARFAEKVVITILPRVLGHGGFAGGEISISYLDRNYAGNNFSMVLHHEMVHILDAQLGGDLRPSILVEGLAVYLSGGHFKPEPLLERAAALLEIPADGEDPDGLGWFIPLRQLTDAFYPSQHEIGYLQAGALVQYMVERWGWQEFSAFYRDIPQPEDGSQAQAVEDALTRHFGLTLEELERDFLALLRDQLVTANHIEDVRLTVLYYDTLRRYQRVFDPSAYFRTAWLLDNREMRRRNIVADYLRRPQGPENLALENLLVGANQHFLVGSYPETQQFLDSVNATIDILAQELEQPELESQ
jgi:hypothetical protein